jgi:hypothetical protein
VTISNGYCTLADVKLAARMGTATSTDDPLLETSVEAASRLIDGYCERRFFTNGTETRTYAPHDYYVLDIDDVASSTITVKTSNTYPPASWDVTWGTADFQREPGNAIVSGIASPVTRLRAIGSYLFPVYYGESTVQVTSVFGYGTAVPTEVKHATVLLALRQYKRYDSPTGVLGFGDFGPVRVGSRLDPDVAMILSTYRRTPVAVA